MNLNENEQNYSASNYRTPDGAPTDIVIFTIASREKETGKKALPNRELQVLLIRRKAWPFQGQWALPGGFTRETETVEECAIRELEEEAGVKQVHMEFLNVYSKPGRDPRGWMISHAFCALVNERFLLYRRASDDAEEVQLFPLSEALGMELAFDHRDIIRDAYGCIQRLMITQPIAKEFLAEEFTIGELYQIIQTVVPTFEERNFIRKITATQSRKGLIEEVRHADGSLKQSNQYSQRAAQLYRFTGFVPELSIYS
ncbi:ADP-ribose pyrophosphatase [Paenibacillus glycanilyticus]|uniref:ADP-ribose pyrophosphatase n=1 Tax=Paenibacillus glycanilyticus TaxID=126569 RepID=A0ABQ6G630_9BACL|nr:NUDIX hydrolase [Paenibacillus glycanilyticus]GLX65723.1 ADP-ribose pyrophosphatase [Paenibacillus glycanilyticus]